MKTKVNHFTDELKLQVVHEYMDTDVSYKELMQKYNIRGNNNINNWMRKFGLKTPSEQQIALQRTMSKQIDKTVHERELEAEVQKLKQQLEHERLRILALNTLIDVAERDLKISIRKKAGAKQ
jgi:transposase-like protein